MSFEGNGGFRQSRTDQRPVNTGAVDNGVKPPARDAWNQPITEPVQRGGGNNDQQQQNDDGINDDDIDKIWSDVKKEGSEGDKKLPDQQQQQQQQAPKDPSVQMREYLDSVGLQPITITDEMKAKMQEGDFSGFLGDINAKIAQSHIKAISGSKQLMESLVADAVKKAVGESKDYVEGRASLEALHTALPFTKDPAIGPVAQTVMQRLLNKGATREEALEGVKRWSKKFVSAFDPDWTDVKPNRGRNGNFSGNDKQAEVEDWVDVLSSKR